MAPQEELGYLQVVGYSLGCSWGAGEISMNNGFRSALKHGLINIISFNQSSLWVGEKVQGQVQLGIINHKGMTSLFMLSIFIAEAVVSPKFLVLKRIPGTTVLQGPGTKSSTGIPSARQFVNSVTEGFQQFWYRVFSSLHCQSVQDPWLNPCATSSKPYYFFLPISLFTGVLSSEIQFYHHLKKLMLIFKPVFWCQNSWFFIMHYIISICLKGISVQQPLLHGFFSLEV